MKRIKLLGLFALVCQLPAMACSVCYGNANSPQVQGMSMAVLFLLVIVVMMLSCIATFVFVLWYRASRHEAGLLLREG
ncbi:MAG: hypothetical protein KDC35_03515 [Acidobacteria bacterium]|nr:hypothetical protein [Acidobacteriota bacterium]